MTRFMDPRPRLPGPARGFCPVFGLRRRRRPDRLRLGARRARRSRAGLRILRFGPASKPGRPHWGTLGGALTLATAALTFENFPSLKSHFLKEQDRLGRYLGSRYSAPCSWPPGAPPAASRTKVPGRGRLRRRALRRPPGRPFAGFFCPASAFPARGGWFGRWPEFWEDFHSSPKGR